MKAYHWKRAHNLRKRRARLRARLADVINRYGEPKTWWQRFILAVFKFPPFWFNLLAWSLVAGALLSAAMRTTHPVLEPLLWGFWAFSNGMLWVYFVSATFTMHTNAIQRGLRIGELPKLRNTILVLAGTLILVTVLSAVFASVIVAILPHQ